MKRVAVAVAILSAFSGMTYAHDAGEFFIRAGSATVRPTEGSDNVLGSLGGLGRCCRDGGLGSLGGGRRSRRPTRRLSGPLLRRRSRGAARATCRFPLWRRDATVAVRATCVVLLHLE